MKAIFSVLLLFLQLYAGPSWQKVSTTNTATPQNVVALFHFDQSLADTSGHGHSVSLFGTAGLTNTNKFGSGSLSLAGQYGSDYARIADSNDFDFGIGDFCVSFWVYKNADGNEGSIFAIGGDANGLVLRQGANGNILYFVGGNYGNLTIPTGQWTHVEISRTSGVLYGFLNGTLLISQSSPRNHQTTTGIAFRTTLEGTNFSGGNFLLDEFMVQKAGGHTTNFTPPTAPY